jgi:site-specific DNA-cytosine methylase
VPKPLDPTGLAGAFAAGAPTSLDFLIPARPSADGPAEPAPPVRAKPQAKAKKKKATKKTRKKATRKKSPAKKATRKKVAKKAPAKQTTRKKASRKKTSRKKTPRTKKAAPVAATSETVNETPTVRMTRAALAAVTASVSRPAAPVTLGELAPAPSLDVAQTPRALPAPDSVLGARAVPAPVRSVYADRHGWAPGTPEAPRRRGTVWRWSRRAERWVGRVLGVVLLPGPFSLGG